MRDIVFIREFDCTISNVYKIETLLATRQQWCNFSYFTRERHALWCSSVVCFELKNNNFKSVLFLPCLIVITTQLTLRIIETKLTWFNRFSIPVNISDYLI